MATLEWAMIAIAGVGLAVFVRACIRRSLGDALLGLLLPAVATVAYFYAFSLTHIEYLGALLLAPFLVTLLAFPAMLRRASGKVLAAVIIILIAVAALGEYQLLSRGNALLVIEPYRTGGTWRFDEPRLHLQGEPFVQGMPEMIDKMVEGIPGSDQAVRLIFSQRQFPGHQHRIDRRAEQDGGNWYHSDQYQMDGWLCPALFRFFPRAPRHIYVRAEAR